MIRSAQKGDLPAIAALQIASWQRSYAGLLPDKFLKHDVVEILQTRWSVLPNAGWSVLTAWDGTALSGFITLDWTHDGGPYVDNLHVASTAQGKGTGRALVANVAGQLVQAAKKTMWLTVMQENTQARKFYARIGGKERAVQQEYLYDQLVTTFPVWWTDLPKLAAISQR